MTGDTFEDRYLSGRELYGDDFSQAEIDEWFESEREGYANLGSDAADGGGGGTYSYHALNFSQGFKHLSRHVRHALGVGSAFGEEFEPIADRLDSITILEPSEQMVSTQLGQIAPTYVKPDPSGTMPFDDGTFDLVVCFGTLHHIPNVSFVVREMGRVLGPSGQVLIREPIVSMGDWRQFRGAGLTERERGIPRRLLLQYVRDAGLIVDQVTYSGFPVTMRLGNRASGSVYSSRLWTKVDVAASRATSPLYRYHAASRWQKLRPTSMFIVAHKPPETDKVRVYRAGRLVPEGEEEPWRPPVSTQ